MDKRIPPALADIDRPRHVNIVVAKSLDELMKDVGLRGLMGYAGSTFFGTAFVQGERLQFTTAIPIGKLTEISEIQRSKKGDSIESVLDRSNRPTEPKHSRELREYLINTACVSSKFIIPSFTFNYGVGLNDESPEVTLILLDSGSDGTNTWPSILYLPPGAVLDTTDGAHRRDEIGAMLFGRRGSAPIDPDKQAALKRNAVDIRIVFEYDKSASHQDFADCAKAKPLPASLVATFDVRDERNAITKDLVRAVPFLDEFVDATASGVNLSSGSKKIWSMSAVRMFVSTVLNAKPNVIKKGERWADAIAFMTAAIANIPVLQSLDVARSEAKPTVTVGSVRDINGGNVLLRGVGMALLSRAFLHCLDFHIQFEEISKKLAALDWHVLDCARDNITNEPDYGQNVMAHANPLWRSLLVLREGGFRVSSIQSEVDKAWKRAVNILYPSPLLEQMAAE